MQTSAILFHRWRISLQLRRRNGLVTTVKPRFNEPLFNEVRDITNDILRPGQSYSKMYGIEPRYNEFFDITHIIRKPKRKIYVDITNYNVNKLKIQHATADKRWTDLQSANPYGKIVTVKIKRQQLFRQELIICLRHWHYSILQKSPDCVRNQSLTMTSI